MPASELLWTTLFSGLYIYSLVTSPLTDEEMEAGEVTCPRAIRQSDSPRLNHSQGSGGY